MNLYTMLQHICLYEELLVVHQQFINSWMEGEVLIPDRFCFTCVILLYMNFLSFLTSHHPHLWSKLVYVYHDVDVD